MRVVFLSFQENTDIVGVKYLHAYMTSKGHESTILLVPRSTPANVAASLDYVARRQPDVCCFSAMTYEFPAAISFARALKARVPGCPIVFGGIHATADPESCLAVADVVVRGEGEETLLALLESLDKRGLDGIVDVHGIVYKRGDRVMQTAVRGPIHDLDGLPDPRHLPDAMYVAHGGAVRPVSEPAIYRRYARYRGAVLSIVSSRGCPYSCRYCCNSLFKSLYGRSAIRKRSPDSVVDEIAREVRDHGSFLYVNFLDDCFMAHTSTWTARFAERYAREIGIPFCASTTPKHVERGKLLMLREAGLRWVFMGLQSGSNRINRDVYGRNVTSEEFLEAAQTVAELDLCPWYDVILDNPYEVESDRLQTIDTLLRAPRPFQLQLFSLDYFPGTELRRRALADNLSIPALGSKIYTKPEGTLMNHLVRMSATLPRKLVRLAVHVRRSLLGRAFVAACYRLALLLEPFSYVWLVYRSNDRRALRTLSVIRMFYMTAIRKLVLRKLG